MDMLTASLHARDRGIQCKALLTAEGDAVLKIHKCPSSSSPSASAVLIFSPNLFVTVRVGDGGDADRKKPPRRRCMKLVVDTLAYNEEVLHSRQVELDVDRTHVQENVVETIIEDISKQYRMCSGLNIDKVSDPDLNHLLIEKYRDKIFYRSRKCSRLLRDSFKLEGGNLASDVEYVCPFCLCISNISLKLEERQLDLNSMGVGNEIYSNFDDIPDSADDQKDEDFIKKPLRKRHMIERRPCPQEGCHKKFKTEKSLLKHTSEAHKPNKTRCPVPQCKKSFTVEQDRQLVQHLTRAHPDQPETKQLLELCTGFKCKVCNEDQSTVSELAEHERTCKQNATCELCGQVYASTSTLKVHKRSMHSDDGFVCDEPGCGKKLKTKASLMDHKSSVHRNQKMYVCHGCGKDFRYRHQRRMCENKHMGKFIHPCRLCDKKFNDKRRFEQHMRVHTGAKPFACPICSFRCSRLDNLNLHTRKSHGVTWKEAESMTGLSVRTQLQDGDAREAEKHSSHDISGGTEKLISPSQHSTDCTISHSQSQSIVLPLQLTAATERSAAQSSSAPARSLTVTRADQLIDLHRAVSGGSGGKRSVSQEDVNYILPKQVNIVL